MNNSTNDANQLAIHRSLAYGLFAELFEYPEVELHANITQGDVLSRLHQSMVAVEAGLGDLDLWSLDLPHIELESIQDEYTRLFDVGLTGKPPCPLMGSAYAGAAKMKSMEEALRFYNHFGLILNQEQKAMPDQLGTELEFLHFLAFRQAELIQEHESHDAYRRAERDFLNRELLFWMPKMTKELNKITDTEFYKSLALALESLLKAIVDHPCMNMPRID